MIVFFFWGGVNPKDTIGPSINPTWQLESKVRTVLVICLESVLKMYFQIYLAVSHSDQYFAEKIIISFLQTIHFL